MTAEPEHSGLRPLSPYGEGYCRVCHFVVGLDPDGRLDAHDRGVDAYGQGRPCLGELAKPPRVTPYASRDAAFRISRPRG